MSRTKKAKRNLSKLIDTTIPMKAERAMTAILTAVGNKALEYTPREYGPLIASQDRTVFKFGAGTRGTIIYTQKYAAALHERTNWKPKPPKKKKGPAWNPKAQPKWMIRADKETKSIQEKIVTGELKL